MARRKEGGKGDVLLPSLRVWKVSMHCWFTATPEDCFGRGAVKNQWLFARKKRGRPLLIRSGRVCELEDDVARGEVSGAIATVSSTDYARASSSASSSSLV
jgi:hypothetical protein